MHFIDIKRQGQLIIIDICANAFLHHMVRNIAGVLMDVGNGQRPAAWVAEVLLACDRRAASITAPASGLYLIDVEYPSAFELPASSANAWFGVLA